MRTIKFMMFCIMINSITAFADTSVSTQQGTQKWKQESIERAEKLKKAQHRKEWDNEKIPETPFPKTVADLSFPDRLQLEQESFEPYKNLVTYRPIEIKPDPEKKSEVVPGKENDNKTEESDPGSRSNTGPKIKKITGETAKAAAEGALIAGTGFTPALSKIVQDTIETVNTTDENANPVNTIESPEIPEIKREHTPSSPVITGEPCAGNHYRNNIEKCPVRIVIDTANTSPGCYTLFNRSQQISPGDDFLNKEVFYPELKQKFCVAACGNGNWCVSDCFPAGDGIAPYAQPRKFTAFEANRLRNAIDESYQNGKLMNYNCNTIKIKFEYFQDYDTYMDGYINGTVQPFSVEMSFVMG